MKRKVLLISVFISFMVIALVCVTAVHSQEQEQGEQTFEADKGAESIDVSGYPEQMQEYYEIFFKKCSKCHTIARPINTDFTFGQVGAVC